MVNKICMVYFRIRNKDSYICIFIIEKQTIIRPDCYARSEYAGDPKRIQDQQAPFEFFNVFFLNYNIYMYQ